EERERDAMNRHRTLHVLRRIPIAALRLLVELLPVVVFALLFWTGLAVLDMRPATERVYTAVGIVTIGAWSLLALLRSLLSPKQPALRLIGSGDDFARRLYAWLRILVIAAAVAAAMIQWAQAIAMPTRGVRAMARLIVLIEHLLIAGMIWNLRRDIAEKLTPPRRLRERPLGRALSVAAHWWWLPALFFDLALWLVWAAQIRDGYERIWRLFLSTAVILIVARLAAIALLGLLDRLLRLDEARAKTHPLLQARVQRYYPILRRMVGWALVVIALIALLQAWGLPALDWLRSGIGQRVTSAAGSIVVAVIFAVVGFEFVSLLLERQVDRYVDSGQSVRAGRLRTLLPIIRSVLLVALGIIVIFTVLSQIGVNVAPLLAGASIIGVALGFGSQKLVQDFITGIFLLLENAMQVGDTVTAGGLTGVVEHLSVRTLRLRAGDGSVHIIPFSSVSTVTNVNRGRGNAAVSFDIAPSADVDRAADILKAIALAMRTEDDFRDGMLSDLQYWGVNAVSGTAVNLAGQIVCTDSARWAVQRAFNRRVLLAFRDKGIELANTMQTIQLVGTDPGAHDGPHA
ncbi:mechanosensitive ion channel, partial [Endobacter medicaginis]